MTAVASKSLEQNSAVGACLPRSARERLDVAAGVRAHADVLDGVRPSFLAQARAPTRRRRARGRSRQRAGHQRDALVAQLGQVGDHVAGRGAVVDRGIGMGGRFVVDQHVGHAGAVQIVQRGALGRRPPSGSGRRPDGPSGPARPPIPRQVVAGGGQHDAVAGFARAPLGALEALGEHRVRQRGQDQADGAGAARAQAATHAVGAKARALAMLRIWASVSGCTISGWLNARETVAGETPALRATSMMEKRGDGRAAMSLCFAYMLKTISSYKTNMTFVLHGFCAMLAATQQHEANMREHDASHENHRGFR